MKSLSAALIVIAGLACLVLAPWLLTHNDTETFVMFAASVVTTVGVAGWLTTLRSPRGP